MFDILTHHSNLSRAFSRLNMIEAMRVKRNIDQVFTDLNMPSQALIMQMRAEGMLESPAFIAKKKDDSVSDSVVQNHLGKLFLDYAKLKSALSEFSLAQRVACKESIDAATLTLKLPSESLMAMMAQEGVDISHVEPATAKEQSVDAVRAKLNAASKSKTPNQSEADAVKARLNALAALNAHAEADSTEAPASAKSDATESADVLAFRRQLGHG